MQRLSEVYIRPVIIPNASSFYRAECTGCDWLYEQASLRELRYRAVLHLNVFHNGGIVNQQGVRDIMHRDNLLRERFGLRDGQFFAEYKRKNVQWFLNGWNFGFGDLRISDAERIQLNLKPGEMFIGYNEHHGSDFQQTRDKLVTITSDLIEWHV